MVLGESGTQEFGLDMQVRGHCLEKTAVKWEVKNKQALNRQSREKCSEKRQVASRS